MYFHSRSFLWVQIANAQKNSCCTLTAGHSQASAHDSVCVCMCTCVCARTTVYVHRVRKRASCVLCYHVSTYFFFFWAGLFLTVYLNFVGRLDSRRSQRSSFLSSSQSRDYRHLQRCPTCYVATGIQTQVLMTVEQAFLTTGPSLWALFLFLESSKVFVSLSSWSNNWDY